MRSAPVLLSLRMRTAVFFCVILLSGLSSPGQVLRISITGIRSSEGTIRLYFYTSNDSFEKEKPLFTRAAPKTGMANGTLTLSYSDIKPGTYGIALLDDENNNLDMDYGWFLPKEGFGFSNHYHTGFSKPKLSDFDFTLGSGVLTVEIRIRYL